MVDMAPTLRRFAGQTGGVRGQDDLIEGKQGVVGGRRFAVKDVQPGSGDLAGPQGDAPERKEHDDSDPREGRQKRQPEARKRRGRIKP